MNARAAFMAAFEPAGGWRDQAELDKAFRQVTSTQQDVIVQLATTGACLVRLQGGFWTTAGRPANAAGIPDWWVSWQTVRAMERKGLLVRMHTFQEDWRDSRGLPAQPKAVAS